jgi:glyoxylase-like metal-dependent hydrolase (beta-lactamase superfamily II)
MGAFLDAGGYRVRALSAGVFRLDGGAMFGSVPKALWQARAPADAENRIELSTRVLYLESRDGRRRILIDLGNGEKFDEKSRQMFALEPRPPADWGVPLDGITDVILTHLHFDHAGGISRKAADGRLELCFPRARVHLQRANWENARAPTERERASYLRENIEPLERADLRLLDGDGEVLPGIRALVFDGHTRGLQGLVIGDGPGAVAFPSDLIPTASHLHLPWIMGYDRCAETTLEEKRRFLERAAAERWVLVFEHDPRIAAASVQVDERGRYAIDRVVMSDD